MHRSLVVTHFYGPTVDDLEAMRRVQLELLAEHERLSTLSVIKLFGFKLGPGVREKSEAMQREFGKRSLAQANVVLGDGFGAVVTRSLLGGLNLLLPSMVRSRTFSDCEVGLDWLLGVPGQDPELALARGELNRAIQSLCREVDTRTES